MATFLGPNQILSDTEPRQTNLDVVKRITVQQSRAERSQLNNSIQKLKSNVLSSMQGISSTSRFLVTITAPNCFNSAGGEQVAATDSEQAEVLGDSAQSGFSRVYLPFLCSSVNLPGFNVDTQDIYHYGYGYRSKMPSGQIFPDVTCTFYGDSRLLSKNFFTKWLQSIVNFNGAAPMNGTTTSNGAAPFEIYYKEGERGYQTTIDITLFDVRSETVATYKLHNAFPVSVSDVSLAWENSDQIYQFTVTFSYDFWTSTFTKENSIENDQERNINTLVGALTIGAGVEDRTYRPNLPPVYGTAPTYSYYNISNIVDTLAANTLLALLNRFGRIR
jgi:hypothetical protein